MNLTELAPKVRAPDPRGLQLLDHRTLPGYLEAVTCETAGIRGLNCAGGLHQKAHGCCRWSSRWSVVVHDERDRCPVLRSVRWSWSGETPGWSSDREPSPGTSPDGSGCGTSARTTPTGTRTSASLEDLDARRPDIVVLPDVPYRFRACAGPEMSRGRRQRPGPGPQATAVGQPGVAAPCTARHYVKPPFVPAETGSAPVGSLS